MVILINSLAIEIDQGGYKLIQFRDDRAVKKITRDQWPQVSERADIGLIRMTNANQIKHTL